MRPNRQKPPSVIRAEYEIDNLRKSIRIAKIDALIARVRAIPDEVPKPYNPEYFVEPDKGYRIPYIKVWKRWLESRMGTFTLQNTIKMLCLSCAMPIDAAGGELNRVGVRGSKISKPSTLARVTVGCKVWWYDTETQIMPDGEVITTEKKVYRIVTAKGLGCPTCQLHYIKLKAELDRQYQKELSTYTAFKLEILNTIEEYKRSTPNPKPELLRVSNRPSPKQPNPFILINPKIEQDKTVEYWRTRCQ